MIGPNRIYKLLLRRFGFQNWWPGETSFEVFVGAILTQQTSWKNVEKAIAALKKAQCLNLDCIATIDISQLEMLIRPSGYYRQKAKRLKSICRAIKINYGSLESFFNTNVNELRERLLNFNGIGKETADSIILYAANKPVFVIDLYTRRALNRINRISMLKDYDALQMYFYRNVKPDINLYKDIHAQFVELGKKYCKKDPECEQCPLKNYCSFANSKK
ncbi:MAG: endonuclease III domain-containing protein [Candidatus Micrarchaeia archaeon]